MVNGTSVHGLGEFHDGVAKVGVASKDSRFNGGGTAILRKEGRVKIKNTLRFE